ncbi:zinc-ribbon domain-containing protein [Terrimonas pollutisoli]|uniref:zinc-ribbon domain-containing protein n=1 Tax=Terrimonas pollutisoli TaxID=3034147 RepID=UPI0023EADCD9|nr:zinc-ribbon domain-containing protein [Terrimonas sp. H1YJ31]
MIIYGTRSKELAKQVLTDKCPNCGTQNSMEIYVFQKYAHVFWIPLFPMSKTALSQCNHCKQVLKEKQMSSSLLSSYSTLKEQSKTPKWTFSGLALIVALVAFAFVSEKKKDEKNAKLILSPQSGDIFEIKTEDHQYTLYKVDGLRGDSVLIRVNNYETNKVSGLNDLKKKGEAAYSEDLFAILKKDLQQMLDKGEIMDIERK